MARKAKVNLVTDCTAEIPKIAVDQAQLQQALINVVVNGMQAMPRGGDIIVNLSQRAIPPDSETNNGDRSDWAVIAVADQGVGISPEHLETIFDPFFTTKDVGAGTGLGLSITHGIISEHQGKIEVESAVGKGTTVRILLPLEEKT
jgi:signal transduction histidine kinase